MKKACTHSTVETLHYGQTREHMKCPDNKEVFPFQRLFSVPLYVAGTTGRVLIRETEVLKLIERFHCTWTPQDKPISIDTCSPP